MKRKIRLLIHGGAENKIITNLNNERKKEAYKTLEKSLIEGFQILEKGGTCLDAVEKSIIIMENSPIFNAGKGAVFTNILTHELDASIMNGSDLNVGAVASVSTIKNPIKTAKNILQKSPYVLLVGKGAENFAKLNGLELVKNTYFSTDYQKKKLTNDNFHFGTVGAVAIDEFGNLASGTSTGGISNKKEGRVGDTPIIGAGTYANDICAISATGQGEIFTRCVVSHDIAKLVEYRNLSIEDATKLVFKKLEKLGGQGGVIVLDKKGNSNMFFNTDGMFRGEISKKEFKILFT